MANRKAVLLLLGNPNGFSDLESIDCRIAWTPPPHIPTQLRFWPLLLTRVIILVRAKILAKILAKFHVASGNFLFSKKDKLGPIKIIFIDGRERTG
jgi:hypothetical protein